MSKQKARGIATLASSMLLGLGSAREVRLYVRVTRVLNDGFSFVVINGGWTGTWRAGQLRVGREHDTHAVQVAYVPASPDELPFYYNDAIDSMNERLGKGHVSPALRHPNSNLIFN